MRCPACKASVSKDLSLCPRCGHELRSPRASRRPRRQTSRPQKPPRSPKPAKSEPAASKPVPKKKPPSSSSRRVLLWTLPFALAILLSIGAGALIGLHQGQNERDRQAQELADEYYERGIAHLMEGEYGLARAEFEYVLDLAPDHALARRGLAEAEAAIAMLPTPTVETYEIAAADLYSIALSYFEDEEWQDAAATLIQLRKVDSQYEPESVEDMLFTSLYNAGMELLGSNRLEEGVFYLDQAEALRPLDDEAVTERDLATRYMSAVGYWGADWESCIESFEELYAIAPDYRDVYERLREAHLAFADSWYLINEMCPAEEYYTRALEMEDDPEVAEKRDDAAEACTVATPSPAGIMAGSNVITLTEIPQGFNYGRLAYPVYNANSRRYDVYALFADGRLVGMAADADQPCWVWSNGTLGYRDLSTPSPGLRIIVPGEEGSRPLMTNGGLAWPTFSPDGTQVAYAQQSGGNWQVVIAPVDGSEEPVVHARGKNPAWGPAGMLAWTGCDADGYCGIFIDNPADEEPPERKTASINDIGLHWSQDGAWIAYMGNHTGDWEIYRLNVSGQVEGPLGSDPEADDGLPAWAPDGSGIAFVSDRDGIWGIYLMGPNGENPHRILILGPSLPNWTQQRLSWAP
jgi:tetratricopeptide (TPR) repeat protein